MSRLFLTCLFVPLVLCFQSIVVTRPNTAKQKRTQKRSFSIAAFVQPPRITTISTTGTTTTTTTSTSLGLFSWNNNYIGGPRKQQPPQRPKEEEEEEEDETQDAAAKYFLHTSGFQPLSPEEATEIDQNMAQEEQEARVVFLEETTTTPIQQQKDNNNGVATNAFAAMLTNNNNNTTVRREEDKEEWLFQENAKKAARLKQEQEKKAQKQKQELIERIESGVGKKGNVQVNNDNDNNDEDDDDDNENSNDAAAVVVLDKPTAVQEAEEEKDAFTETSTSVETTVAMEKEEEEEEEEKSINAAVTRREERDDAVETMQATSEVASGNNHNEEEPRVGFGSVQESAAADQDVEEQDDLVRRLSEAYEKVRAEELAKQQEENSGSTTRPPKDRNGQSTPSTTANTATTTTTTTRSINIPAAAAPAATTTSTESVALEQQQQQQQQQQKPGAVLKEMHAGEARMVSQPDAARVPDQANDTTPATMGLVLPELEETGPTLEIVKEDPSTTIAAQQQQQQDDEDETEKQAKALRMHEVTSELYRRMTDKATGTEFPSTLGPGYYLTGVGVRKRAIVNVYAVGMYTSPEVKDALMIVSQKERQQALCVLQSAARAVPTTFVLQFVLKTAPDVVASTLGDAIEARLQADPQASVATAMFKDVLAQAVEQLTPDGALSKGNTIRLDCHADGVTIGVDGTERGTVPSAPLSRAVCDIYLDDKTFSPQLRDCCLQTWCAP